MMLKSSSEPDPLLHLLLALLLVLAFAQIVSKLSRGLGQPPVVGEMVAGILLGPSFLGSLFPEVAHFVLPVTIMPHLRTIAQIGVVLYMFLVGLELDIRQLRRQARIAATISASGIAVPLLLGSLFSGLVYSRVAPPGVSVLAFGAFFCVALSVTAFPVLARIVSERGLDRSAMGRLALTCAAVDDIAAWCLLSLVVGLAHAEPSAGLVTLVSSFAYVVFMVVVVRPIFLYWVQREEQTESLSRGTLGLLVFGLLVSALLTQSIGIHALFGAFLVGALIPPDSKLAQRTAAQLENVVAVLFLPIFFAFTGLRTHFGLISGTAGWSLCLLVVVIAFAGKAGGVGVAAWLCGIPSRTAIGLGALMNTRGLMQLIVLNVGLDLGIISPTLFAIMIIMALVTTCSAGPVLALLGEHASSRAQTNP